MTWMLWWTHWASSTPRFVMSSATEPCRAHTACPGAYVCRQADDCSAQCSAMLRCVCVEFTFIQKG